MGWFARHLACEQKNLTLRAKSQSKGRNLENTKSENPDERPERPAGGPANLTHGPRADGRMGGRADGWKGGPSKCCLNCGTDPVQLKFQISVWLHDAPTFEN